MGQDRPQYLSNSYLLSPFLDQALWAQTQGSLSLPCKRLHEPWGGGEAMLSCSHKYM